jgi:hypothetical protein
MNSDTPNPIPAPTCQGTPLSTGAYFLAGERIHVRCQYPAEFVVSVNPPSERSSGKVLLCRHCNKWDYDGFPRQPLNQQGASL